MRAGLLAFAMGVLFSLAAPGRALSSETADEGDDARESRKEMAGLLNGLLEPARAPGRSAEESLSAARALWTAKVRPWMEKSAGKNREDAQKESDFQKEFLERLARRFDGRIRTVEDELKKVEEAVGKKGDLQALASGIREIVWALSHQPEGFEAPSPPYTWKDWAIALAIGFGHLAVVLLVAFYLRRRYRKAVEVGAGGT